MSIIAYCPNGGQNGIRVSDEELKEFSDEINNDFMDEIMPLPNMSVEQQQIRLKVCKKHDGDTEYWERDNGSHGWCCSNCGKVIQWG